MQYTRTNTTSHRKVHPFLVQLHHWIPSKPTSYPALLFKRRTILTFRPICNVIKEACIKMCKCPQLLEEVCSSSIMLNNRYHIIRKKCLTYIYKWLINNKNYKDRGILLAAVERKLIKETCRYKHKRKTMW